MDVRGRAPQGVSPKLGRMDRLHRYGRHIIYRDLSSHVLFSIWLYAFALSSQEIIFLRLLYVVACIFLVFIISGDRLLRVLHQNFDMMMMMCLLPNLPTYMNKTVSIH